MEKAKLKRLIAKTLAAMLPWFVDIRNGKALEDIVNSKEAQQWLVSRVRRAEELAGYVFDPEGSIDWSVPYGSTIDWEFVYRTWLYPSKASFGFEMRRGKALIKSCEVDSLEIDFDVAKENVNFYFRYKIVIEIRLGPHARFTIDHWNPDPFLVRGSIFYHWSEKPVFVPLKILVCCMRGEFEDWDEGIVAAGHDDQAIRYGYINCPKAICKLFQLLRERAFDDLYSCGYLTKEDYRFIAYRLRRMGLYPLGNDPRPEEPDTLGATNTSNNTTTPPMGLPVHVEALKTKKIYVERLREIAKIAGNPLFLLEWAKPLRLASKSAVSRFFDLMQKKGLITVTKTDAGFVVVLTEKAKLIIAAAF